MLSWCAGRVAAAGTGFKDIFCLLVPSTVFQSDVAVQHWIFICMAQAITAMVVHQQADQFLITAQSPNSLLKSAFLALLRGGLLVALREQRKGGQEGQL